MATTINPHTLMYFSGADERYRHWTRRLIYTEGVHYLVENGAAWLVDAVASYQGDRRLLKQRLKEFQLWELRRVGQGAVLSCREDSDEEPVITQEIEFTDFPLETIKLYVCDGTLMLPSEY